MSVAVNLLLVLVALGLVALNGFFVAAEFALVKLRQTQARELAETHGWRGRVLLRVHRQLDAYLSACQLGITLASLGLGWVGEPAFAQLLEGPLASLGVDEPRLVHGIAFAVAFTLISFLHIVLGELAPKSLALRRAEGVSLWLALPLYVFHWIMYPPIQLLNWSAAAVLRLTGLGAAPHGGESAYSQDELRMILLQGQNADDEDEAHMNAVLAQTMELQDLEASDLMRPRRELVVLHADDSHAEMRRTVQKHGYSRYPFVEDDGRFGGLVHVKDLLLEPPGEDFIARLRRQLRPLTRVRADLPATELLRAFRRGVPHLALVEDGGQVVGFVTLEDVIEAMLGDIADEHDQRRPGQIRRRVVELPDGGRLMRGDLPLFRLERELGVTLDPEGEVDTVAGLLMQAMDRVPARGDTVDIDGWRFTVQRAEGPRVELVGVRPLEAGTHPA